MESVRLPRFKRAAEGVAPVQLTDRDREIIRLIYRHRFLRSSHIVSLVGDSSQQVLRRLQLLFHHGFLNRPRAQLDYYHRGGSQRIVYGLGNKGIALLKRESGFAFVGPRNQAFGRQFLEHALLASDIMVTLELACRENGQVKFLAEDEITVPEQSKKRREPFQWNVNVSSRLKLGLVPDRVFALDFSGNKAYFFLEADRSTMPVTRQSLTQSSFYRKLLAYEATWTQGIHRARFGFHRFRVLTVTTSAERVKSLVAACGQLERGQGLFLFTDHASLSGHPDTLSALWHGGRQGTMETLFASANPSALHG